MATLSIFFGFHRQETRRERSIGPSFTLLDPRGDVDPRGVARLGSAELCSRRTAEGDRDISAGG